MFPAENLRDWRGKKVIDPDGSKIGDLDGVYVDTATDEPTFVTVRVGTLAGRLKLVFAPVAGATVSPAAVRLQHPKKLVKDAPSIELDGEFGPDEERDVFAHYDLEYVPGLSGERRLAQR